MRRKPKFIVIFQVSKLWRANLESNNKLLISREANKILMRQNKMKKLVDVKNSISFNLRKLTFKLLYF